MDDNHRLDELLKIKPENMSETQEKEFFHELEKATLFLPIDLDAEFLDFKQSDLGKKINTNEPINFAPIVAKQEDGHSFLPLFTNIDAAEEFNQPSFISVGCKEVAALLVQTGDVDAVVLNPGSTNSIGMSIKTFLGFASNTNIKEFEKLVVSYARPLKTESRFYLRENIPLMRDAAENGIFISELPFNASFKDNCYEDYKYLNILIVPKGVRFLYIGDDGEFGDSMFPPIIKFKLIEEEGNTFTWKCIYQSSNNNSNKNKFIYLILIIFIVIIAIISFLILV